MVFSNAPPSRPSESELSGDSDVDAAPFQTRGKAATSNRKGGQGKVLMTFESMQKLRTKDWMRQAEKDQVFCKRILSKAAIATIEKDLKNRKHANWSLEPQPPYMAPSPDPLQYPLWCCTCKDFNSTLILCSGCRVTMCCVDLKGKIACLAWDKKILKDDFIFFCPFCTKKKKIGSELGVLVFPVPKKLSIGFRLDPPVLIIAMTWHQSDARFGSFLDDRLTKAYAGNGGFVCRLEISLSNDTQRYRDGDESYGNVAGTIKKAERFLDDHPRAKIVVVIDTHASDNGAFVWKGSDDDTFEACFMLEIIRDCLPKSIYRFLVDKGGPDHFHASIIINLACGASVIDDIARDHLREGHAAEAVLSFAIRNTVVADVMATVTDFVAAWVQTESKLDLLVFRTMSSQWASRNRPVLSTAEGHFLYIGNNVMEPNGQKIVCHRQCGQPLTVEKVPGSTFRVYTCPGCSSTCTANVYLDPSTDLSQNNLVVAQFPQVLYPSEWKLPKKHNVPPPLKEGPRCQFPVAPLPSEPSAPLPEYANSNTEEPSASSSHHPPPPPPSISLVHAESSSQRAPALKIRIPPSKNSRSDPEVSVLKDQEKTTQKNHKRKNRNKSESKKKRKTHTSEQPSVRDPPS